MNSGPQSSSNSGRLIACTVAQWWPLLPPRSRNHRPPGQGSIFIGILACGVSFSGPICSSRASNVFSRDAFTRISLVRFRVSLSSPATDDVAFEIALIILLLCSFVLFLLHALSRAATDESSTSQMFLRSHTAGGCRQRLRDTSDAGQCAARKPARLCAAHQDVLRPRAALPPALAQFRQQAFPRRLRAPEYRAGAARPAR